MLDHLLPLLWAKRERRCLNYTTPLLFRPTHGRTVRRATDIPHEQPRRAASSTAEKSTVPADPPLRGVVGETRASPRQRAEGAAGCNSHEQTLICLRLLVWLITTPVAATRLR